MPIYLCGIRASFVVKNTDQNDECSDDIGLCAQNTITILGSTLNLNEWVYVTCKEKEMLHFDLLEVWNFHLDLRCEMTKSMLFIFAN
jgi:hypothetical protein